SSASNYLLLHHSKSLVACLLSTGSALLSFTFQLEGTAPRQSRKIGIMKLYLPSLLLGAAAVAAHPASYEGVPPEEPVSPEMLLDIYTFAAFSHAAYCNFNSDGLTGNRLCNDSEPTAPCAAFGDSETVYEVARQAEIAGNVAVDHSRKLMVVAFHGRATPWVMLQDVEARAVSAEALCEGCRVHHGLWTAFDKVREQVGQAVRRGLHGREGYRLVATGHSYGGAAATLAAAYLRGLGYKCDLFTYGSPRVGNREFAEYASNPGCGLTARVTNKKDAVAAQPLIGWRRTYAHVTPEYWFEAGIIKDAAPGNPHVCHGTQVYQCSGQYKFLNPLQVHGRVKDHKAYNRMSQPCPRSKTPRSGDEMGPSEEEVLLWNWEFESGIPER
ncbi:Uncharacterized protein TPAR_01475, partial [Tolypocladium paradoxum]